MGWFGSSSSAETVTFERYGSSSYQLCIKTPEDLLSVLELDERLWMTTSCPVFGMNVDPVFLRFLDVSNNGRILSDELRAAIRWMQERLIPDASWTEERDRLALRLIRSDTETAQALLNTARVVLGNLNLDDAEDITLGQVRDRQKILMQADQNGDGVIPPEAITDPATADLARDVLKAFGGVTDVGGLEGVDQALLDRFVAESTSYVDWHAQGMLAPDQERSDILPYGAETASMWEAVAAVHDQIDQFYAQCTLVRFDPRTAEQFALRDDEFKPFEYKDREAIFTRLNEAPIYPPNADGLLGFDDGRNDVYRDRLQRFRDIAVRPILGDTATLSQDQWQEVLAPFGAYRKWLDARPDTPVAGLGAERLKTCMEEPWLDDIRAYIARDTAVADEMNRLENLEKLILFHQLLFQFTNNFVSLPWLFDPQAYAMFEMGTLVLAGREFATSLRVDNRAAHAVVAKNSDIFLLYLAITGPNPTDNYDVVVPVTRGNPTVYYVGQRGVFFTTNGRELDAQVVLIVDNLISLSQSLLAPFWRLKELFSKRFEQLAASVQKEAEGQIASASGEIETAVQKGVKDAPAQVATSTEAPASAPPVSPSPSPVAASQDARSSTTARDLLIGAGFLVAGVGTAVKFMVDTMRQLGDPETLWNVFLITSFLVTVVVSLTALSAWLKLRRRDLSGVLQACGWAMNARLRLNRKMVCFFVRMAELPPTARKYRRDRLSERLSQLRREGPASHVSRRQEH